MKICDYGEKAFKDVKIETISFLIETITQKNNKNIVIESYINESFEIKEKIYILSNQFPYWLLYRNEMFDKVLEKLEFGIFQSFRDRQITNKILTQERGEYRVLKSRNIGNNEIVNIENYDTYINDIQNLSVSKFLNQEKVVMVPNLTYYPRATFLPKNSITDGSVALLTLKNQNIANSI